MSDQAGTWGLNWERMGWPFITTTSGNFPIIAGGAEEDGDSDDDADDATEGEDSGSDDDDSSSDTGKSFTQDDVDRILAKERKRSRRGAVDVKELGFDSKQELADFVKSVREQADKDKDEETKSREEAIESAKQEAVSAVLNEADRKLLKAEFKVAAREAGIPKDRLEDAFSLAQNLDDWQDVEVDKDGNVAGLDEDFFGTLKEQKSYLFGSDEGQEDDDSSDTSGGSGAGTRAGGKGDLSKSQRAALLERYPGLTPVSN